MSTITPFPDPDDWDKLNSIFRANRNILRWVQEANSQPMRELQRQMRGVNRGLMQDVQRQIRELNRPALRGLQEQMQALNRQPMRELQQMLSDLNRQPMRDLQEQMRQFNRASFRSFSSYAATAGAADLEASTAELAAEVEAADVEADEGEDVLDRLAHLPLIKQLGILIAVLTVLDAFGKFLADAANADVPDEVRSLTQTMFAIAMLLMLLIDFTSRPPDE